MVRPPSAGYLAKSLSHLARINLPLLITTITPMVEPADGLCCKGGDVQNCNDREWVDDGCWTKFDSWPCWPVHFVCLVPWPCDLMPTGDEQEEENM